MVLLFLQETLPCAEDDDGYAKEAFKDCLEAHIEEKINCSIPWRSRIAVNYQKQFKFSASQLICHVKHARWRAYFPLFQLYNDES